MKSLPNAVSVLANDLPTISTPTPKTWLVPVMKVPATVALAPTSKKKRAKY